MTKTTERRVVIKFPFTIKQINSDEVVVEGPLRNVPVLSTEALSAINGFDDATHDEVVDKMTREFDRLVIINSIRISH